MTGVFLGAALALMLRDLRRVARRPGQIFASLATPLLFWLVIAGGLTGAIAPAPAERPLSGGYGGYLAPGFALLVVLFSAIFGAIGLIEDRRDGLLRQVALAATPRGAYAFARCGSTAVVAWLQAAPLLVAGVLAGSMAWSALPAALVALAVTAIGVAAISIAVASRCDTSRAFHGYMNTILMPAWLLSGAVFPLETAAEWIRVVAAVNPLAWAHRAIAVGGPTAYAVAVGAAALAFAAAWMSLASDRALMPKEGEG